MCLLITGKSNAVRAALLNTNAMLDVIFRKNGDGVGAMYPNNDGTLAMPKALPKTLGECNAFIAALPDDERTLALHFRMKTHGDIDLDNCHPYPVIDGVALMHNGVLRHGNDGDKTKSDTWHYVAKIVRPMLEANAKLFTLAPIAQLMANDIGGNNKFAIMDKDGELVVLNKSAGIEHAGIWFSNTYAWEPSHFIPTYHRPVATYTGGHWDGFDDTYNFYGRGARHQTTVAKGQVVPISQPTKLSKRAQKRLRKSEDRSTQKKGFGIPSWADKEEMVWSAIASTEMLAEYIHTFPMSTLNILYDRGEDAGFHSIEAAPAGNKFVFNVPKDSDLTPTDRRILDDLEQGDVPNLIRELQQAKTQARAFSFAFLIVNFGDFVAKQMDDEDLNEAIATDVENDDLNLDDPAEVQAFTESAVSIGFTEEQVKEAIASALADRDYNKTVADRDHLVESIEELIDGKPLDLNNDADVKAFIKTNVDLGYKQEDVLAALGVARTRRVKKEADGRMLVKYARSDIATGTVSDGDAASCERFIKEMTRLGYDETLVRNALQSALDEATAITAANQVIERVAAMTQ